MNKYRELAQRLGYPDEENLEENINSYGDPLPEWWAVMKELQSQLEQAEKENKKQRELLGRCHDLIYNNSLDYKLCYEIEKQIEL